MPTVQGRHHKAVSCVCGRVDVVCGVCVWVCGCGGCGLWACGCGVWGGVGVGYMLLVRMLIYLCGVHCVGRSLTENRRLGEIVEAVKELEQSVLADSGVQSKCVQSQVL